MLVNLLLLVCSLLGIISTALLVMGLYADRRCLLLPWIFIVAIDTLVEIIHSGYMFVLETINFNPITAILFTLDFFLVIGHIYSFLCVLSQYQEYLMGRGTAEDYRCEYANHQRALAEFSRTPHSPTQSFHTPRNVDNKPTVAIANSTTVAFHKPTNSGIKKRVQFPDEKTVTFVGIPTCSSAPGSPVHADGNIIEEVDTNNKTPKNACVVEVTVEAVEKKEVKNVILNDDN